MKQYIDKSAVVAEIERYKHKVDERLKIKGRTLAEDCKDSALQNLCGNLLHFLKTLEVKEADLDNEYIEEVYSHLDSIKDTADRMTSGNFMHHRAAIKFSANTIAKVLELMGLKAQKGEWSYESNTSTK